MANNIAIISGASSGIGKATALLMKENGFHVYAFNRSNPDIPGVEFVPVDLTKTEDITNGVRRVVEREGRIDVLVNNAGVGFAGALEETADETAKHIFDVNFFGAFRLAKEVIPVMRENGGGNIINISSISAVFSVPFQGFYSASKAAVNSLFGAMSMEVKPFNIHITNIMPGDVKSGFTDSRLRNGSSSAYEARIKKSMSLVEKDERNGMPPAKVAQVVLKYAQAKKGKLLVTVGAQYKMLALLYKLMPSALMNQVLYSMYGGNG